MKLFLQKLLRKFIRAKIQRSEPNEFLAAGEKKLRKFLRQSVGATVARREFFAEKSRAYDWSSPIDQLLDSFPVTEKSNTFRRFPLQKLLREKLSVNDLASILTSSGHGGGGFAFGLSTKAQLRESPFLIDLGLELAFEVDRFTTLLINCLPMGVTFQSNAVCVANVSVREDMAVAIVDSAGGMFEQIIIVGDPLFLKKFFDYATTKSIEWGKYRVNIVLGEETFSENYRTYLANKLQIDLNDPKGSAIISSMGVGELGLNLFTESRETVFLRRFLASRTDLLATLFGGEQASTVLPTFLTYSPLRIYVEVVDQDGFGIGDLVITVLDPNAAIPMIRYKTGDRAAKIDFRALEIKLSALELPTSKLPIIALFGRVKDLLPNGDHVDHYKAAMYRSVEVADCLAGAFRLKMVGQCVNWDVQLTKNFEGSAEAIEASLFAAADGESRDLIVNCIRYEKFPHGQTIDYERKFIYLQH
jgi:phenylacetate-CoA ligase